MIVGTDSLRRTPTAKYDPRYPALVALGGLPAIRRRPPRGKFAIKQDGAGRVWTYRRAEGWPYRLRSILPNTPITPLDRAMMMISDKSWRITPTGWIVSARTGRRIDHVRSDGYRAVGVWMPGAKVSYVRAHRIVFQHFYGAIENELTVDHINGNRRDNHPRNLRLLTRSDNTREAALRRRRARFGQAELGSLRGPRVDRANAV